jgi:hypothetical protein
LNSSSAWSAVVTVTDSTAGRSRAFLRDLLHALDGCAELEVHGEVDRVARDRRGDAQVVDHSASPAGSASATPMTMSVSSVASGARASRPSAPNNACRCRVP